MPITCADTRHKILIGTAYNNTSTDESDGSLNANGCTKQDVTNTCQATMKYLRGQKIDVATVLLEKQQQMARIIFDADVVKGLKDGTVNFLAAIRLSVYSPHPKQPRLCRKNVQLLKVA